MLIKQENITIPFLLKQGRQLFRLGNDEEFCFAYHPQNTGLAPSIGYLIRCEETLKKIYYVTSQRSTMALPTVHIHIVMKSEYHKYDESRSPHKNCAVCHRAEEKSNMPSSTGIR